jgi:surfeit locus 1 family protein
MHVQWFTMAAVLAIFFLLRSSNLWQLLARKRHEA